MRDGNRTKAQISKQGRDRRNNKKIKARKKQWRQTAHKTYRTPSLITFAKPKRH
jgi:hypothetical protein